MLLGFRAHQYATKILGNIASEDDAQCTQKIIDNGGVEVVKHIVLNGQTSGIRKEALFILSNIAAGTEQQSDAVGKDQFISLLLRAYHKLNIEKSILKEMFWTLQNLTCNVKEIYMMEILNCQNNAALQRISNFINITDNETLGRALSVLTNICSYVGEKERLKKKKKKEEKVKQGEINGQEKDLIEEKIGDIIREQNETMKMIQYDEKEKDKEIDFNYYEDDLINDYKDDDQLDIVNEENKEIKLVKQEKRSKMEELLKRNVKSINEQLKEKLEEEGVLQECDIAIFHIEQKDIGQKAKRLRRKLE
ncbi:MAG: hypothetical protein EZS28_006459 [Streblomastix strix]|uniref:Uncharacterized protein n=1 Tax=Streblomastix strix TaxID=222440 RepID=A0A5J4WTX3_9EUKA|nr:MAG: hypothetical protein EZS28_006459 [Streblomastix strix]